MAKTFTTVTSATLAKSLINKLQPVADNVRDLASKFGLRPYKVSVITTRWTGPNRGEGTEVLVSELVLLPTPAVNGTGDVDASVGSVGTQEIGIVDITEISGRYTEDQLRGYSEDGAPPARDVNVWWEIVYPQPGGTSQRRRYTPASRAVYNPGALAWEITLDSAIVPRDRGGGFAG